MGKARKHRSGQRSSEAHSDVTLLETLDQIRRAVRARRSSGKEVVADTQRFRPVRRPSMALLCVLDDGRHSGEWLRLRGDHIVIGRDQADVVIAHDPMISSRHAELSRRLERGRQRWCLTDLQSTNGTYVRISHAPLKHNQELLIGSHRYRFEMVPQAGDDGAPDSEGLADKKPKKTRDWEPGDATLVPALVQLTAHGDGARYLLSSEENWIGREASFCVVNIANDLLVSPRHARFFRDAKGRWQVENGNSLNGTWLRIEQMALKRSCQFQLGEQRFLMRVL